jgi:hypothetical protein
MVVCLSVMMNTAPAEKLTAVGSCVIETGAAGPEVRYGFSLKVVMFSLWNSMMKMTDSSALA